jgi:hypothetical protein
MGTPCCLLCRHALTLLRSSVLMHPASDVPLAHMHAVHTKHCYIAPGPQFVWLSCHLRRLRIRAETGLPCCCRAAVLCIMSACSPSDAAVKAFLGEMGLTLAELKARPGLAKRIVASHLLLGSNVRAQVGTQRRFGSTQLRDAGCQRGAGAGERLSTSGCWILTADHYRWLS